MYWDSKNRTAEIEIDRINGFGYLAITTLTYDAETQERVFNVHATERFAETLIVRSKPGVYDLKQSYKEYGEYSIKLTVKENRKKLDVVFEPGEDCIDFIENKIYVYKDDDKEHYPALRYICEGEEVFRVDDPEEIYGEFSSVDVLYMMEFGPSPDPTKVAMASYPGTFKCVMNSEYPNSDFLKENENVYQPIDLSIIIQIIP